jgi:hypothetical protein
MCIANSNYYDLHWIEVVHATEQFENSEGNLELYFSADK